MFCPKCGNKVADGIAFCPSCGNKLMQANPQQTQNQYQPNNQYQQQRQANPYQQPQNTSNQTQNQYGQPQNNPYQAQNQYGQPQGNPYQAQSYSPAQKKAPNKKLPIIIGVAAAAVVALILIFVVIKPFGGGNMNSPEGTLKKMESALNELDIQGVIDCFDSSTREMMGDISSYTSEIEAAKQYIDMLGASFEFHMTGSDFNYYTESGREYCSCYVQMDGKISFLGQEETMSDSTPMVFVKENGQWYVTSGDVEDLIESLGIF